VNSNKLTHNLAGMATSGFELDVARGLAIRRGSWTHPSRNSRALTDQCAALMEWWTAPQTPQLRWERTRTFAVRSRRTIAWDKVQMWFSLPRHPVTCALIPTFHLRYHSIIVSSTHFLAVLDVITNQRSTCLHSSLMNKANMIQLCQWICE
jgi:hypothetical protein